MTDPDWDEVYRTKQARMDAAEAEHQARMERLRAGHTRRMLKANIVMYSVLSVIALVMTVVGWQLMTRPPQQHECVAAER